MLTQIFKIEKGKFKFAAASTPCVSKEQAQVERKEKNAMEIVLKTTKQNKGSPAAR